MTQGHLDASLLLHKRTHKVKIVFVNSCPYLGGAEWWQFRAAAALRERRHRVKMLLRPGELAQKAKQAKFNVETLPMAFDLDLYSFAMAWRFFRQFEPDIVIMNDQRECRIIGPAAKLAKVGVVVQRKGWPFLKGSWRDQLTYRHIVTHMIANSESVADVFREKSGLTPEKITVIKNGVDLSRFQKADPGAFRKRLGIPESGPVIGSAGRLVTQKGFDVLIQAAGILHRKGGRFRVVIAGQGPLKKDLLATAVVTGINERLVLPGQVNDMPSFLSALDLFVFPSRMEGLPNAVIEAMAASLPIIATDIPGNNELITHEQTGLLVPSGDANALSEAVSRLMNDRELSARLGSAARSYVEANLDSKNIFDELNAYLSGLVKP